MKNRTEMPHIGAEQMNTIVQFMLTMDIVRKPSPIVGDTQPAVTATFEHYSDVLHSIHELLKVSVLMIENKGAFGEGAQEVDVYTLLQLALALFPKHLPQLTDMTQKLYEVLKSDEL